MKIWKIKDGKETRRFKGYFYQLEENMIETVQVPYKDDFVFSSMIVLLFLPVGQFEWDYAVQFLLLFIFSTYMSLHLLDGLLVGDKLFQNNNCQIWILVGCLVASNVV